MDGMGDASNHARKSKRSKPRNHADLIINKILFGLVRGDGYVTLQAVRILATIICAAFTVSSARTETLSAPDREALLEKLENLRDAAMAKVDARFRIAMAAYRDALASDDAAMDLYLRCIEKVNFTEQRKDKGDFLAWKRQDEIKAKLSDPSFRLALRVQLRWLILTLQASSEKANRKAISGEAQEVVDGVFRDAEKFAGYEQELEQAVTSTIFARAYEIGPLERDKWPSSPIQLEEFYGTVVFPPLRTPSHVDALHAAWIKRIQQEGIKVEAWGSNKGHGNANPNGKGKRGEKPDKTERKIGMAADMKGAEYERFVTETVPELQWRMEEDLFRSGDESGAAMRMLKHLEKHINHKSARNWGEEFKGLLKPKVVAAPPAVVATPVE